jgi:hypothetical protein
VNDNITEVSFFAIDVEFFRPRKVEI